MYWVVDLFVYLLNNWLYCTHVAGLVIGWMAPQITWWIIWMRTVPVFVRPNTLSCPILSKALTTVDFLTYSWLTVTPAGCLVSICRLRAGFGIFYLTDQLTDPSVNCTSLVKFVRISEQNLDWLLANCMVNYSCLATMRTALISST